MLDTTKTRTVTCAACRREVPRHARQQIYCSNRCRKRAHEKRRGRSRRTFLGGDTGAPDAPPKKRNGYNDLQGPKTRPTFAIKAPVTLLGVGWHWPGALVLDRDVVAKISRLEIGGVQ